MNSPVELAGCCESHGSYGSVGVKILVVSPGYELSGNDEDKIGGLAEQIRNHILLSKIMSDPVYIERKKKHRDSVAACFPLHVFLEEVPSKCSVDGSSMDFPWYCVTTPKGRISVGCHGDTITLDWKDSTIKARGRDLFPNEMTSVGDFYVHAHSYEDVKKYVSVLLGSCDTPFQILLKI